MAFNAQTTTDAGRGFAPDLVAFPAQDAVPDALILKATTVVDTQFRGDAPSVVVPWVKDETAVWGQEGRELAMTPPAFSQTNISVRKLTQFMLISNELWQSGAEGQMSSILSQSSMRTIVNECNRAFMQATPTDQSPLIGVANTPGRVEGGAISTSLDPLADTIAQLEANGATPTVIIANPLAWGTLRNLKLAKDSNASLLGAGTEDQGKKLFGIEVITSPAVPDDQLVIIDPASIASVVGQVSVANSEHVAFQQDSTALRVTWHLGWGVQRPDRLGTVTVSKKN